MKNPGFLAVALLAVAMAGNALAADKKTFSDKQLAQQQRMTDCSAEAKTQAMQGEARKAFMKTCLSGGKVTAEVGSATATAPAEPAATDPRAMQQQKMKSCNADAKTKALKGDERKSFMSNCLSS